MKNNTLFEQLKALTKTAGSIDAGADLSYFTTLVLTSKDEAELDKRGLLKDIFTQVNVIKSDFIAESVLIRKSFFRQGCWNSKASIAKLSI